jgi:hypothetical protein
MSTIPQPKHPYSICQTNLVEQVAPTHGQFTTISVLKPAIWVERRASSRSRGELEDLYRITASFTLEVEINGFDQK